MLQPVKTIPLALVLEDLGLRADRVRTIGEPPAPPHAGPRHALLGIAAGVTDAARWAGPIRDFARAESTEDGAILLLLEGERGDRELAAWRDALWPLAHVGAIYALSQHGIGKRTLQGASVVRGATGLRGTLLAAWRREGVLAPDATVAKFDQNAGGWGGDPGSPGYAHFRWMRRFVAGFARPRGSRRILDFGCGAGWVGIEAAKLAPGAELFAFDPSAEMVKLAEANARASGIERFEARTGFGEDPPFPAAGEEPFDLAISSGVISFAPDPERWLDGLARTVAPSGRLVVGDANRESRGFRRRRDRKPLLPAREMNARTREEVREALERRGFAFEGWAGYQLTRPVPELMHWSGTRARGILDGPLLLWNRLRATLDASAGGKRPERFDSWVMRMRRGQPPNAPFP